MINVIRVQILKMQSFHERYIDKHPYYFGSTVLLFGTELIDDRKLTIHKDL